MHQFNNPHQKDQFDKRNTFKGLTFQDYLDVIPEKYWSESKPYRNGVFFRCWNPEHHDPNPSLLIQPGDTQTCIWKCFTDCPQHIFTNMFNRWLIEKGKIDIQKLPTKTLEGLAYQGIVSRDDLFAIKDRRAKAKANRASMMLDRRSFDPKILNNLEADGHYHQHQEQQRKKQSSFFAFAKERGFYV
ncbi:hypothetical protein [Hyphomonas sp.]|uniref:hypothetical protein n=1 Tax=Hyphomonas sp. TaxID=87 RepID=UPI000C8D61D0|nr:hypothetical protein [Hyphomonas sp.]MAL46586.1 hypothetical protein [Hyphomonas sp.]